MGRHTTFRYALDPTRAQQQALLRHAGASRFAFNTCLRGARTALADRRADPSVIVPWTGFDLINYFNGWKRGAAAGRVFTVAADGTTTVTATGLAWRDQVAAQVFEEAAVDCARALRAWADSRSGARVGRRVGWPRLKSRKRSVPSFRLRCKTATGRASIRVGADGPARSVTLPKIGVVRVHDDTRRLRRMLATRRAKVLFATVSRRGGRWWVSLNVEAADLHPARHHLPRHPGDHGGWVGVDRGLVDLVVAARADGTEVAREPASKPVRAALPTLRRLGRAVTRKEKGSSNRKQAAARLGRAHTRLRAQRAHRCHQVSNQLVNTHDRLAVEDLHVPGMLRNHHLAAAISDAAWGELGRQLTYKTSWRGGQVVVVDRWYPSSKTCSACGHVVEHLPLDRRVFDCPACPASPVCRDRNAAANLAAWAERHSAQAPDPEARGRDTNARREDSTGRHPGGGETVPDDAGTRPSPPAPAAA